MQFPPELRGSQPFLTSGFQQPEQPWGTQSTLPVTHGPPSMPATMPTAPLHSGLPTCATPPGAVPPWPSSSPPLAAFTTVPTPWVQTVPNAMPWGTYPTPTTGELQVMRFSAGEAPRWAVNERHFRKRHLPPLVGAGFPPRKQIITEEKITAQMSDLSLDGMVAACSRSKEEEEKRLHVLYPDLEPSPEPLLPRPVLEDLRKRTSMAVVLWQPPPLGRPPVQDGTTEESSSDTQEQESGFELVLSERILQQENKGRRTGGRQHGSMTAIATPGESLWHTSGDMLWSCLDSCGMSRLFASQSLHVQANIHHHL
ncbi:uncharacterized protein [Dermacentor albipictus]|uniref:uncharacterized protein isoform X2 n=1 Tax=Dermacentor albipictus TaxID=60249 RepID=UPI0031FC13EE